MKPVLGLRPLGVLGILILSLTSGRRLPTAETAVLAAMDSVAVPGGLCVQLGTNDLRSVRDLASSGRFLVHVIGRDRKAVLECRSALAAMGLPGISSVDHVEDLAHLPYTENLVNLFLLSEERPPALPVQEVKRILTPGGVLLQPERALESAQLEADGFEDVKTVQMNSTRWLCARKPWPAAMDDWPHPRHSPSGNPVSGDRLVGPPRRVRWLAGPWKEVSNMVTVSGRIYYSGVLARDAFNGLRLWEKALDPSPAAGGFGFQRATGSVALVADTDLLFVHTDGKVLALDGATGKTVHEYPVRGRPRKFLHQSGALLVVSESAIEVFDVDTSALRWHREASDARAVVIGDELVTYVHGNPRRGEEVEVISLDRSSGELRWRRKDFPWLPRVADCVYYRGKLAFEVSSFNDHSPNNSLHVLSARDGTSVFDHEFPPAMSHYRQARAIFIRDELWVLHGGNVLVDGVDDQGKPKTETRQRAPRISSIDLFSGKVQRSFRAGLAHCFPPVATERYYLSGEMNLTDLDTGRVDANHITKAACSRDGGWVPANGLIYVSPKHCVCWPMLRGYAALAPARPGGNPAHDKLERIEFPLVKGDVAVDFDALPTTREDTGEWPCYRHDAWRSASTSAPGPRRLKTLWSSELGRVHPGGPLGEDWSENPFASGPITAPVIAEGNVYVARPDAQQVVALDASTGKERWRFTASGRIDTAPTIHQGLCLFGSRSGYVYCLRATDGMLVWRLRAAPMDERIVTYGQLESPWPVPGSVLVIDGVAYFAAGRQPLADGGILVFAVDPRSGAKHWVRRHDSVPQKGFYNSSGLEFDNFDLLHRQGEGVAMSRWVFNRKDGAMSVAPWQAYARLNTGRAAAWVPQGCWSYAPRHIARTREYTPRRSLVAFRDNVLVGCLQGMRATFRRDFRIEQGEEFDTRWMTGWKLGAESRDGKSPWQTDRLARKASWVAEIFDATNRDNRIVALVLASDRHFIATTNGELQVRSTTDGQRLDRCSVPAPLWDGLAVVGEKLYLSTQDGAVICIGG